MEDLRNKMSERDFVADVLQVTYQGVFDFDGLYKALYRWFQKYRYGFKENDYKEFKEGGVKKLSLKWSASRRVTDYIRYVFEVGLSVDKMQDVMVKNKKKMSGSVTLNIAAYIEKDYEEQWSNTKMMKFIREVYDRFVTGSKIQAMQKELLGEMNALRAEMKSFLDLQKVGEK